MDSPRLRSVEKPAAGVAVRRVRKAYEQVADQLRDLILGGDLPRGTRLPNEQVLAAEFGVSRATVREALRLLAAQNLIRTAKGAGGGSYVTMPSVDHLSAFLRESLALLTESRDLALDELLEARALLEVPAARLAASRRTEEDVERLRATIPGRPLALTSSEQFVHNKDFHSVVLETCRNSLLVIAAQPIFSVLQTHLARSSLGRRFHAEINAQHTRIAASIERGDGDAAAREMALHLDFQREFYERAWRDAGRGRSTA